ncbi:hypothetical protein CBR_g32447 [Chara braunii]|uniref:Nodulin homeobox N-terminal domain-containing protein n=1 Tax=Chara braunii TaxID=69332 RepID=A0A388LGM4_CHABU|nr:hypothetical protein CBR_g32447 [Chara braunii]|eukprot:GBG81456.1 hypothetical protein CBR_g32447 [Chara braunii]
MDASVEAVRKSVELLKAKLQAADVMDDGDREGNRLGKGPNAMEEDWSSGGTGSGTTPGLPSSLLELMASHTEASVHALHLMCQSQAFRDRVLQHKELCENGGVMRLAYSVLSLAPPGTSIYTKSLTYTISRMKARILEMVWMLSMAESASFLDKAMENLRSRQVATEVADQVLIHLRAVLLDELEIKDGEFPPGGQLYLNTLRVADVLSDDTNFRRYIMRRVRAGPLATADIV